MENATYMEGYAEGFSAAMAKMRDRETNPVIGADDLIKRYGGKISRERAQAIIRAVRHKCGGGMLGSSSYVMLSELVYWESTPDTTFTPRL